jgi:pantoate--beta-alanine ligase
MQSVNTVAAMQKLAGRWKAAGKKIAFVPTMGWLHDGHLSLIKVARKQAGRSGVVVVSIYVNPTQFGHGEDFGSYPRDLARDTALCEKAGADVLFAPSDREMYAGREEGRFSTYVVEDKLSGVMEGVARPQHFRGVTTVVAKLFNIVLPDIAVFGAKDFQQGAIIQRVIDDLNFPVTLVIAPTVREPDGLAMSSRNSYLTGELRTQATVLWQAIKRAQEAVASKGKVQAVSLKEQLRRFIEHAPAARVDYIEFFDPATLEPVYEAAKGVHMALAVYIGKTRLIDNAKL